tara:strand:+ start:212 stop:478 length:267 start_codon:yes stop_codon:yes gene_type:complete
MNKEYIKEVEVKYDGKVVGWVTVDDHSTAELNVMQNAIRFVDEDSRKLIEQQLQQPISISCRRAGKVDNENKVTIIDVLDLTILKPNQ